MSSSLSPEPPASEATRASPWRTWRGVVRESAILIGFSAFLVVALWGALVFQIRRERHEAIHNAEVNLSNLAHAFAEHTARTMESADQALRFVRAEYADHGQALDIAEYLRSKTIIDSTFHLISIIGPDGYMVKSSQPFTRMDLSDREHFRVHAQGHEDRLHVSKPVLGRVSKKWSIQLTRRIDRPDGSFGGVVVLSLSPDYVTRLYQDVKLGHRGTITLVGYDGVVRARAGGDHLVDSGQDAGGGRPFQEAMRRKNGTVEARSHVDQINRLWAFRSLDDLGLVVFTGSDVRDVYSDAAERRSLYLMGATLITLVILGFLSALLRRSQQQLALMRELELSNRQANAASEMKTRFLASVSHELRTPLNGILGFAELLQEVSPDPEVQEYGRVIHQSGKHLHELVNAILDLARIESGRMAMHPATVRVVDLLEPVRKLHGVSAQARGLRLDLQIEADCPQEVVTDPTRCTQILNNLVHNAIKFSECGTIVVTARGIDRHWEVRVTDEGAGIPPSVLEAVFTRFHGTTTDFVHPAQGAGLGLPLAHELAELLGGSLTLTSREGAGTTAVLRLPIAGPESPPQKESA